MLSTETPSAEHTELDLYSTEHLVEILIRDQLTAVEAVLKATNAMSAAVDAALPRIVNGGRLIYVGAGTSGRLGVLDSVELFPTFSWPHERAIGLLAGGHDAMFIAVEGAEDDIDKGASEIRDLQLCHDDVVLLLAASGATPYVLGALREARKHDSLTIGLANNASAPVCLEAEIGITLDTGNEIISGSTRLKAGTSQKIALNTFSSALMIKLHKVYGNLMVDVKPSNAKLLLRTISLTIHATGCDEATAKEVLSLCDHQVKVAIVAIKRNISVGDAIITLEKVEGDIRRALVE
jgi:N-acetylmuramic acid 6-phosphate etherase